MKIAITISGPPASGKTTVIHLLVRALKRCEFRNVSVTDCLGEQEDPVKCADAIRAASRSEIVIRTYYPRQLQPPKTTRKV
ncbi:MAG TPA: AAA family ATPase [Vicinamibacterales bacterium]|nr:AAA family ATPase [Vicinamibacterales bacterium]